MMPITIPETPFLDLVRRRRSVRRYLDRPVEREKIIACLEAARLAPSAENVQPWRFLVIDDPDIKERFSSAAFSGIYRFSRFAAKAPVIILILGRPDLLANRIGKQIQSVSYYLIDVGIAGGHLALQAEELGLGTCWIGWFNGRKARKFFRIPRRYKMICLMAMGYTERKPRERNRKPLSDIVWFNRLDK
ncbi:MAG: nitroreductase family protein [Candidatus Aminicenantes bacterium]|nr:nitroreductase family protein [Candidatus Aminicenantes bacterium]